MSKEQSSKNLFKKVMMNQNNKACTGSNKSEFVVSAPETFPTFSYEYIVLHTRNIVGEEVPVADDLIKAEMARLVAWDVQNNVPNEVYEENDLKSASELIKKDCDVGPPLDASMWAVIEQCSTELVQIRGKFTRIAVLNRGEQIEALHSQFQIYRDWMNARAKKTGKLEKKLKIKLGGYQIFVHGQRMGNSPAFRYDFYVICRPLTGSGIASDEGSRCFIGRCMSATSLMTVIYARAKCRPGVPPIAHFVCKFD
ncbi:hypothetical protein ANCDUO_16611 [Ancylostoma duodenale]|uniref:Uncharacterized protein n=1 Tax=Ancylostoma duodenale TaxID=51022 RepID=A0A0C2G2Y3_9BILA|nr:hypothetical protein ANCDUO_16611 [Ancylostoma duodenale]